MQTLLNKTRLLIGTLILILLAGCANQEARFQNKTEQALYSGGVKSIHNEYYQDAITFFETEQAQYPYGPYAKKAQLAIIYAYYQNGDFASAQSAAESFIHLHPNSPYIDYATYMRAMAVYAKNRGFLINYFPLDPAYRANQALDASFQAFNDLVTQYPASVYSSDALLHMMYIRNALARNRASIADFYYQRGAYVAAINRAAQVLKHYPHTPAVQSALVTLANSYHTLDLTKEYQQAISLIQNNYPNLMKKVKK